MVGFSLRNFRTMTRGFLSNLNCVMCSRDRDLHTLAVFSHRSEKTAADAGGGFDLAVPVWMTITSLFAHSEEAWGKWEFVQKILTICPVGYALSHAHTHQLADLAGPPLDWSGRSCHCVFNGPARARSWDRRSGDPGDAAIAPADPRP